MVVMEKLVPLLVASMKELGMLLCHLAFMLETDRVAHQVHLKNQMIQFFKDLIEITKLVVCSALTLFSLNLTPTHVGFNYGSRNYMHTVRNKHVYMNVNAQCSCL